MPFNGAGVFRRIYSWVTDAANGVFVDATRTDTDTDDIATALSNCVTRDGQSPAIANIPMGGFKITGLGTGTLATDAVNFAQTFVAPSYTGGVTFAGGMIGTGNVSFTGNLLLTGGGVDLDGATSVSVPTVAPGDNTTNAASTAFVTQAALQAALPALSLGFLRSDAVIAGFTQTHTGYAQNEVKGADIASAANINLTTATGNFVHVTGTTAITSITIPIGAERTVIFDGILTLTQGAALLLPTGANITTAANDRMDVRGDTAGAIVTNYTRANGQSLVPPGSQLLRTIAVTALTTIDALSDFSSSFDIIEIELCGLKPNTDDDLRMRVAVAGVADSGSNYFVITTPNGNATSSGTSFTVNSPVGPVISAGKGLTGSIQINNVNDATDLKAGFSNVIAQITAAPRYENSVRYFVHAPANVLTGVQFFWGGGATFQAAGEIRIYGKRN